MHPYPHLYRVSARGAGEGRVILETEGVEPLESSPPVEFDGPGDRWSPETLLLGALVDCFVLTFRAVARAAKLDWSELAVSLEGTLDRPERVSQFTAFALQATLTVAPGTDIGAAEAALARAEKGCLISNSLKAPVHLGTEVRETSP